MILDWARTIPELQTRPKVLQEMSGNKSFRHFVFSTCNVMGILSLIGDKAVARRLLAIFFLNVQDTASRKWKECLEAKDPLLWNEFVGFYRNLNSNMANRIRMGSARMPSNPDKLKNQVLRPRWWREKPWEKPEAQGVSLEANREPSTIEEGRL